MFIVEMTYVDEQCEFVTERYSEHSRYRANKIYSEVIVRWFEKLCPHINWDIYRKTISDLEDYGDDYIASNCIINHLNYLNSIDLSERSFDIELKTEEKERLIDDEKMEVDEL